MEHFMQDSRDNVIPPNFVPPGEEEGFEMSDDGSERGSMGSASASDYASSSGAPSLTLPATQQWVLNHDQMMWALPQYGSPDQGQPGVELPFSMLDIASHAAAVNAAVAASAAGLTATPGGYGTPPLNPPPTGLAETDAVELLNVNPTVGANASMQGRHVKMMMDPNLLHRAGFPQQAAGASFSPGGHAGAAASTRRVGSNQTSSGQTSESGPTETENVPGLRAIKTSFVRTCIEVILPQKKGQKEDFVFEFQDFVRLAFEQITPPKYRGNVDAQLGRAISDALLSEIYHKMLRQAEKNGPLGYDDKQRLRVEAKAVRSKLQKTSTVKIGDISMPKRIFACVQLRQPRLDPTGSPLYDEAIRHLLSLSNDPSRFQFDRSHLEEAMYDRWDTALKRKRDANRREREEQAAKGYGSRGRKHDISSRSDTSNGSLKRSRHSETDLGFPRRSVSPFRVKSGMLMPMKVQETPTKFIVQVWCPGQASGSVNVRTGPMSIRLWGTLKDTEYFDPEGTFVFDEGGEIDWVRTYDFPSPVIPKSTRIMASNCGLAVVMTDKVQYEEHTVTG